MSNCWGGWMGGMDEWATLAQGSVDGIIVDAIVLENVVGVYG